MCSNLEPQKSARITILHNSCSSSPASVASTVFRVTPGVEFLSAGCFSLTRPTHRSGELCRRRGLLEHFCARQNHTWFFFSCRMPSHSLTSRLHSSPQREERETPGEAMALGGEKVSPFLPSVTDTNGPSSLPRLGTREPSSVRMSPRVLG